ncbi:MAG: outer membrane protein transport protein [Gammaproteobacteria bacterium]
MGDAMEANRAASIPKKTASTLLVSCALAALGQAYSPNAQAAGFALIENGASGLGNAYAGAAAVAEDASTIYFNPAGMSKLPGREFVFAGHYIDTKIDFTNSGSAKISTFGGGPLSGPNADGGKSSIIPSFFYAHRLNNDWSYGLGITVPFGLGTEYDENWVGRYHAVKSEISTININPSASVKVNEKLSIGFGVNAQYIDVTLTSKLDSAAICRGALVPASGGALTNANCDAVGLTQANVGNSAFDSSQSMTGDDWSFGWNIGMLYDLSDSTRLGIAYRSNVDHQLNGSVDFTTNAGLQAILNAATSTAFSDTGITAGIDLPESLALSISHNLNPNWVLMADATWTRWERYDKLVVDFANPAQTDSTSTRNSENSWRYSVGASYMPDEKRVYRFGLALDETIVPSTALRPASSPGNDRLWLSLGYGYRTSDSFQLDLGYAHLFVDDASIDNQHALFGSVTGSYEQSADILSVQLSWLL